MENHGRIRFHASIYGSHGLAHVHSKCKLSCGKNAQNTNQSSSEHHGSCAVDRKIRVADTKYDAAAPRTLSENITTKIAYRHYFCHLLGTQLNQRQEIGRLDVDSHFYVQFFTFECHNGTSNMAHKPTLSADNKLPQNGCGQCHVTLLKLRDLSKILGIVRQLQNTGLLQTGNNQS